MYSYARHEVEVRLPGGFRARRWDSTSRLEAQCAGRTDSAGGLTCEIPPHLHGERFLVRATASDEAGNLARLAAVVSKPSVKPFVEIDSEEAISPGSAVTLDVDLPFARATALVAVHREGVLDAFVTDLVGSNAVTRVPVAPNYAPNVHVSVLARNQPSATDPVQAPFTEQTPKGAKRPAADVAGKDGVAGPEAESGHSEGRRRVLGTRPTRLWGAQIVQRGADAELVPRPDNPTWRRGAVDVPVGSAANTLDVRVTADGETYKPREPVRVRIAVLGPDGGPRPDAEVTVAAVDEGLLDLRPNRSWDILDVMMQWRPPLVDTGGTLDLIDLPLKLWAGMPESDGVYPSSGPSFSGSRVDDSDLEGPIGRRRFNSLLLWQARVGVDAEGLAEVEVPLHQVYDRP
ncbi:MAG: hypothetical protein F4089_13055 [Gammaproteobacteria bacterium]|nr:hypothetical protein [Gammaproteobacteria bacterium]